MTNKYVPNALKSRLATVEGLSAELTDLQKKGSEILQKIVDFKSFDPKLAETKITEYLEKSAALQPQIDAQNEVVGAIAARLDEAKEDKVSPLKVWKYFSSEQKDIRKNVNEIKDEHSAADKVLNGLKDLAEEAQSATRELRSKIAEFEIFDAEDAAQKHKDLARQIANVEGKHLAAAGALTALQTRFSAQLEHFNRAQEEIAKLDTEISAASRLSEKLTASTDEAEREKLSSKSQAEFGHLVPAEAVKARMARKGQLEQECAKLEGFLAAELAKDVPVERVLVDGAGLLYRDGQFIGAASLQAVVAQLSERYTASVVFSPMAAKLLGRSEADLRQMFGPTVPVQFAPTAEASEALLIDLAEKNESTVILSNAPLTDFAQSSAVRNGRVYRFIDQQGIVQCPGLGLRSVITS